MPEPSTVGVIVPVRGASPFLAQALDGILTQTPAPADVVVVDDASQEPVVLPDPFAGRCRLVRRETRGGPAGARQSGLEALRTPLVALCDADDVWEQGKLAAQTAALERYREAALCFGRATVIGPGGLETGERWAEPRAGLLGPDELRSLLYVGNPLPTSSVLMRAEAVAAVGGFESHMYVAEDWDLWLRLVTLGATFFCEPDARIRYRRHGGGLTRDTPRLARATIEIHERHAALVEPGVRASVRAADLRALASGRIRERDYGGARTALREAATHAPPTPRERAVALLLGVPGLRAALGRRSPYPTARS